jgi:hypothetical protein
MAVTERYECRESIGRQSADDRSVEAWARAAAGADDRNTAVRSTDTSRVDTKDTFPQERGW